MGGHKKRLKAWPRMTSRRYYKSHPVLFLHVALKQFVIAVQKQIATPFVFQIIFIFAVLSTTKPCFMKSNLRRLFFLFISLLLAFSCEQTALFEPMHESSLDSVLSTKGGEASLPENHELYIVSDTDIEAYIKNVILEGESKNKTISVNTVTPYKYDDLPVFYIIDYNEGWEIVSADKRGPVVLGGDSIGSFEDLMSNEAMLSWVSSLGGDILNRRYDANHYVELDQNVRESEEACLRHWASINAEEDFINSYIPKTKVIHDSISPLPTGGHWELVSVESEDFLDTDIGHLTVTRWHQHTPHNNACPYLSTANPGNPDDYFDRSPAGCVAIAAAQLLYFYHYKIGIPDKAPVTAYCNDKNNAFPHPTVHVDTTMSTTVWDSMDPGPLYLTWGDTFDASYALIADIGKRVNMYYGNSGSSATSSDLQSVFSHYGLSLSYYNSYQPSLMISSLQRGYPVYLKAYGTVISQFWGWYADGHAFLVDGYKSYYTKYTKTYEWVEPLSPEMQSIVPDMVVIEYTSPSIQIIRMNWGWGNTNISETFSIMGSWATTVDGENYDFIYERGMFYGYY